MKNAMHVNRVSHNTRKMLLKLPFKELSSPTSINLKNKHKIKSRH